MRKRPTHSPTDAYTGDLLRKQETWRAFLKERVAIAAALAFSGLVAYGIVEPKPQIMPPHDLRDAFTPEKINEIRDTVKACIEIQEEMHGIRATRNTLGDDCWWVHTPEEKKT